VPEVPGLAVVVPSPPLIFSLTVVSEDKGVCKGGFKTRPYPLSPAPASQALKLSATFWLNPGKAAISASVAA
jgi:hypothetical protein